MAGLGYRRDMADWDCQAIAADFFEVAPENWIHRDRRRLHELRDSGRQLCLHGVSLNLGGHTPLDDGFLDQVRQLMTELDVRHYSDHLAASGDTHQLHDLFPIAFTQAEVMRVSDRIRQAQDILGQRIAIENTTWYTNTGEMDEVTFLGEVARLADCEILLDLNNIAVNHKNHGGSTLAAYLSQVDLARVTYLHVAGHEFDARFGLYIDTHSQPVEADTARWAHTLNQRHGLPILLEWDNDIPSLDTINRELACLTPSMTM